MRDSSIFIKGIESYANELKNLNLTHPQTLSLLESLRKIPGVQAVKGCGALGADVVLVATDKNQNQELQKYCDTQGLAILASSEKFLPVFKCEGPYEPSFSFSPLKYCIDQIHGEN